MRISDRRSEVATPLRCLQRTNHIKDDAELTRQPLATSSTDCRFGTRCRAFCPCRRHIRTRILLSGANLQLRLRIGCRCAGCQCGVQHEGKSFSWLTISLIQTNALWMSEESRNTFIVSRGIQLTHWASSFFNILHHIPSRRLLVISFRCMESLKTLNL